MTQSTLEKRVAVLEQQVSELLAAQAGQKRAKDWRRTFGAFTDDELMKQIFEEGRKIREAERRKAGAPSTKKPRTRS